MSDTYGHIDEFYGIKNYNIRSLVVHSLVVYESRGRKAEEDEEEKQQSNIE